MAFHNVSEIQFTEMLAELLRREKEAKIKPDPDIDAYMKVSLIFTMFEFIVFFHTECLSLKPCRQQHLKEKRLA